MTIQCLTDEQITTALQDLPEWTVLDGKLHRQYVFKDFVQAFGFMTQVALVAEKANHHPEWSNVYKTLVVDLTTHEAGGITERDIFLANKMEVLAEG